VIHTRRKFMSSAIAAFVLPVALKDETRARKTKVLVIGGGMSGISAARILAESGVCDVQVIEARNRLGGRIATVRGPRGEIFELGANWLHNGDKNPLIQVCERFGIVTEPADNWSGISMHTRKGILGKAARENVQAVFKRGNELLEAFHDTMIEGAENENFSLGEAIRKAVLPKMSKTDQELFLHGARTDIEDEYGASIDEISFKLWVTDDGTEGKDRLIPGGYDQLVEKLCGPIPVAFGQLVRKIDINPTDPRGAVTVVCDKQTWHADHVIVTVSLGVLKAKRIEFNPPLPEWKTGAIDRIGFGNFEKAFISYKNAFWPSEASWIVYVDPDPKRVSTFFNLSKFENRTNTLVAMASGPNARYWNTISQNDVLAKAETAIRPLTGHAFKPTYFHSTRWESDPMTLGSYSFPAVRENRGDRELLKKTVGEHLHFAGEATNLGEAGTVHAAYESGIETSKALLEALKKKI
jgi:monoamine oxidase